MYCLSYMKVCLHNGLPMTDNIYQALRETTSSVSQLPTHSIKKQTISYNMWNYTRITFRVWEVFLKLRKVCKQWDNFGEKR
jgi:hypothetical protein